MNLVLLDLNPGVNTGVGMAGQSNAAPVIIKRKKIIQGGGHHGGAWKVAYADFVTAMMAFFLLMWLLGSTSEGDKKGIADYFQSPLKVALLNGGSGSGDSSHVIKGGGTDLTRSGGQVKKGETVAKRSTVNLAAVKAEQDKARTAKEIDPVALLSTRATSLAAACGMNRQDSRLERAKRLHSLGHSVGNVMQFEVKKNRHALGGHRFIAGGTIGIEKFHADFHVARMRLQCAGQGFCLG